MQDLRTVLCNEALQKLRQGYDRDAMRAAMLTTTVEPYPPLGAWNEAIAATFYGGASPLAAVDRERCLIMLLAYTGARFSLGVHVYWGLMEGMAVEEVCHVVGLAATYGGVPSLGNSFPVLHAVLQGLAAAASAERCSSLAIVQQLARDLAKGV